MRAQLRTAFSWHRPLMTTAAIMVVSIVVCLIGLTFDHRIVTGVDTWLKPLKFSISIFLYCVTWAWLISQLPRWRRSAHRLGTVMAVALIIEQLCIVGAAAAGTTSHFNVSTPLATTIWGIMAISITTLYVCAFVTTGAVFFVRLSTPSITYALRAGAVLALIGMGLAYLMTIPQPGQITNFRGIIGAHTVGLADGGPGLPLLGWSTVGGDLRIPHFVGMHALQVMPICALLCAWLGRHWRVLAADVVRLRLMIVVSLSYAATLAVLTFQALAGQSIVAPSGVFLVAGWAILIGTIVASITILAIGPRPPAALTTPHRRFA